MLEGSVQRSHNRFRMNVQLIDTEAASHLWADRFDKNVADLFEMQDEIVGRLARALDTELVTAEARRAARSTNPDATDLIFQGNAFLYKGWIPEFLTQARGFFERALAIDDRNIQALVSLATVDEIMVAGMLTDNAAAHLRAAEKHLTRALSLDSNVAGAHMMLGGLLMLTNRAGEAVAECERALALNRNMAYAHSLIGFSKYFLGRASETEPHVLKALRLSPRDIFAYQWAHMIAASKFTSGRMPKPWIGRGEALRPIAIIPSPILLWLLL